MDKNKVRILLIQEKTILRKDLYKYRRDASIKSSSNKAVYRKNKHKRHKRKKHKKVKRQSIYRYSIAYVYYNKSKDNGTYGRTFRAEVYTNNKHNNRVIERKLIVFLNSKMRNQNSGLQYMYNNSSYQGFESDEVGSNDIGRSELNRMRFYID